MADTQSIKKRLSSIQKNFNPEKNTYKVIEHVVNNNLNYDQMLQELSKIRGFSKYPEELKNEYISIINDIKENIIKQRKLEEQERLEANTKELKDIIEHLEKSRNSFIEKQKEEKKEEKKEDKKEEKSQPKKVEKNEVKKEEVKKNKPVKKEEKKEAKEEPKETNNDKINIDKLITIGIVLVIIITVLVLFLY